MSARDDYPAVSLKFSLFEQRQAMLDEIDRLRADLTVARNQLGNAEGACVDAGTWCDGPADLVAAIGRLGDQINQHATKGEPE